MDTMVFLSFVMSKELEPTEGLRSHVQHNLNVCCQRLSMMVKKMNYEMNNMRWNIAPNSSHSKTQTRGWGWGVGKCLKIINLSNCKDDSVFSHLQPSWTCGMVMEREREIAKMRPRVAQLGAGQLKETPSNKLGDLKTIEPNSNC